MDATLRAIHRRASAGYRRDRAGSPLMHAGLDSPADVRWATEAIARGER